MLIQQSRLVWLADMCRAHGRRVEIETNGTLSPRRNPHGGLLSKGYVHGLNNVAEAVRQLRGDGTNQVRGAGVALCTGFGGGCGSAAILTGQ